MLTTVEAHGVGIHLHHAGRQDEERTCRAGVALERSGQPVHSAAEAGDLRSGRARGAQLRDRCAGRRLLALEDRQVDAGVSGGGEPVGVTGGDRGLGGRARLDVGDRPGGALRGLAGAVLVVAGDPVAVAEVGVGVGRRTADLARRAVLEPVGEHRYPISVRTRDGERLEDTLGVDVSGQYSFLVALADLTVHGDSGSAAPAAPATTGSGDDDFLSDGRLAFYLRRKFGAETIATVRGMGYRFNP